MGQRGWIRVEKKSENFFFNYYEHWGGDHILHTAHKLFRRAWKDKDNNRYGLSVDTLPLYFPSNRGGRVWLDGTMTMPDNPWIEFDFDKWCVYRWDYMYRKDAADEPRGLLSNSWTFKEFASRNTVKKVIADEEDEYSRW